MQNRVSKYYIVGMYVGINFVTKKVISILFALALFSCHPVVNQPTSKSSASDSVELKKQEARVMGTGTLVHSLGAMNLSPMILWFLHSGSSCQLPNGKPIERVCISGLSFTSLTNASVKAELGTMLCSIYAR